MADWSGHTESEVKSALKERHLSYYVTFPDGTSNRVVKSTAKLTTVEWEEFMEKIRADFSTVGMVLPLPNEPPEQ